MHYLTVLSNAAEAAKNKNQDTQEALIRMKEGAFIFMRHSPATFFCKIPEILENIQAAGMVDQVLRELIKDKSEGDIAAAWELVRQYIDDKNYKTILRFLFLERMSQQNPNQGPVFAISPREDSFLQRAMAWLSKLRSIRPSL